MLTSPLIRSQNGFAGVSIHEKIFPNRLRKIQTCDFRNQFCKRSPISGESGLPII